MANQPYRSKQPDNLSQHMKTDNITGKTEHTQVRLNNKITRNCAQRWLSYWH